MLHKMQSNVINKKCQSIKQNSVNRYINILPYDIMRYII